MTKKQLAALVCRLAGAVLVIYGLALIARPLALIGLGVVVCILPDVEVPE